MGQPESTSLLKLLDIARNLAAPSDLVHMLELVIASARELLSADRGSIFLCDHANRQLYSIVAEGEAEIRFNIESGIAGECACKKQIVTVNDCYADSRFNRSIDDKTGYHTNNLISIPLVGFDSELIGVLQLLNAAAGQFTEHDEHLAEILATQAGVAIQRARLMDDRVQKIKLEHDLDLARDIQQNILPSSIPECPGYDIAAYSNPADQTGGDIYDLVQPDSDGHQLMVLLADATGHGIGPALSITQFRAMFRMGLRLSASLHQLTTFINSQLSEDLPASRFVTAFLGRLDPQNHQLTYHAPGQGPLLHYQYQSKSLLWNNATTIPLGLMPDISLDEQGCFTLNPGDIIVLLTDGFYEYQNSEGKQFNIQGVENVILKHCHQSAEQLVDELVTAIKSFAQDAPQNDDLTAIIIKRNI